MSAAETLAAWLDRRPASDGAEIVGWRFEVAEGQGLRVGLRNSRLGGAYEGPGVAYRLDGTLELHWSDGLMTRAGLDRAAILDPVSELCSWRADAVQDRQRRLPPLAGPAALSPVETFDPAIDDVVAARPAPGLEMLRRLAERSRLAGVRRVDAVLRASRNARAVATSRGFRADWQDTSCSLDIWGDEIAGVAYGRRALPSQRDLDRLVHDVSALSRALSVAQPLPVGARGVLFMPNVVDALIGRFLVPNLSGRAIRDGRSLFTRADLEAARQILRDDLSLVVDTTLPLELATAPCSPEGVPGGQVALIADGRLRSPVLDLATAQELGLPPTPVPRGQPRVLLGSSRPTLNYQEAVRALGDGVVVRDLPGLHTQQARRTAYALVTPDAQAVVAGEARGRCAVRLAGNVLGHLTHPAAHLVRVEGVLGMGLLVLAGVELLPA